MNREDMLGEKNIAKRPEIRKKISLALLGKKKSKEHIENMSKTKKKLYAKGKIIPSMLGKHHTQEAKDKLREINKLKPTRSVFKKGHIVTEEMRKKSSESNKGKILSEETKLKMKKKNSKYWRGKKRDKETIGKIIETKKLRADTYDYKKGKLKGENHYRWRGGVTSINTIIRFSPEYKLWRESVFKRDNYTCVWCGRKGIKLNADHIKPFSLYPELRFAIDNGRTLCIDCHRKTDTYARGATKNGI